MPALTPTLAPTVHPAEGVTISPDGGGSGPIADGVWASVPPGAIPGGEPIVITAASVDNPPPLPADADGVLVSPVYDFSPDGAEFTRPISITMPYDPAAVPAGGFLAVILYDGSQWLPDRHSKVVGWDEARARVTIETTHFSVRGVGASQPAHGADEAYLAYDRAYTAYTRALAYLEPIEQAQAAFEKIRAEYPGTPWAIRSLYFLGTLKMLEWQAGATWPSNGKPDPYIANQHKFDEAVRLWEEFRSYPDPGWGEECLITCPEYPGPDDVIYDQASVYMPYGMEVYQYLRDHNWFDGNGSTSVPLPVVSAVVGWWYNWEDLAHKPYFGRMAEEELPQTIRDDIAGSLASLGPNPVINKADYIKMIDDPRNPALEFAKALADVWTLIQISTAAPALAIEHIAYNFMRDAIADSGWPPEGRVAAEAFVTTVHGGISIAAGGPSQWLEAVEDVTKDVLIDKTVEGAELVASQAGEDVQAKDLPRGLTYARVMRDADNGPAFIILYNIYACAKEGSPCKALTKHWSLQNVDAGETVVDDDPTRETSNPLEARNWEPYDETSTWVLFPVLRFAPISVRDGQPLQTGRDAVLDLAGECFLGRLEGDPEQGVLVLTAETLDQAWQFMGKPERLEMPIPLEAFQEGQPIPLHSWAAAMDYTPPAGAAGVQVCGALYPSSDTSGSPAWELCGVPLPVEGKPVEPAECGTLAFADEFASGVGQTPDAVQVSAWGGESHDLMVEDGKLVGTIVTPSYGDYGHILWSPAASFGPDEAVSLEWQGSEVAGWNEGNWHHNLEIVPRGTALDALAFSPGLNIETVGRSPASGSAAGIDAQGVGNSLAAPLYRIVTGLHSYRLELNQVAGAPQPGAFRFYRDGDLVASNDDIRQYLGEENTLRFHLWSDNPGATTYSWDDVKVTVGTCQSRIATATPTPTPTGSPTVTATPTPASTGPVTPGSGDMVLVPAGTFQMGCDPAHNGGYPCIVDELPLHTVYLDAYRIDRTEVTFAQYARCVAAGGCTPPKDVESWPSLSDPNSPFASLPIVWVDWHQAAAYCAWAGKRLPTEAEWEKAARGAGDTRAYPWGDQKPDCTLANVYGCNDDLTAVGSYPAGASPYGVFDMAGNAAEWVNDWRDSDYYSASPGSDPPGPVGDEWTCKVLRGGSLDAGDYVRQLAGPEVDFDIARVAYRGCVVPENRDVTVGFRCAAAP
jgi:formylglycine-generating enzyme required for sulfatase activity